ncbi:MAG: hypothetical protein ACTIL2_13115 [Corynebacterium sp.]|uniref:hypothetical protein n=1 Tax=Corynebacterium sp. TaxID=1720 RepID=UPI003F9C33D2
MSTDMNTDSDPVDSPDAVESVDEDYDEYEEGPGVTASDVVSWVFAGALVLATIWCMWFVM